MSSEAGQQHPLGIYYKIWILLFVLSGFSYAVDYFHVEGGLVLSNHVYVPEGRFYYRDLHARRLGTPSASSDDLSTASGVIVPHWFYDHRGQLY